MPVVKGAHRRHEADAETAPARVTVSGPLREWNVTLARPGSSRFSTTQPEASVAWPHSGTSAAGVNQRMA